LAFTSIDLKTPLETPDQVLIFTLLQQFTMDFFDSGRSSPRWPEFLLDLPFTKLRLLTAFVPAGCSMDLYGGMELHLMARLVTPAIGRLNVVYTVGEYVYYQEPIPRVSRIYSFTLKETRGISRSNKLFQSSRLAFIEDADLTNVVMASFGGPAMVEVLDTNVSIGWPPDYATRDIHRDRFSCLTRLRSTTEVVTVSTKHFDMKTVREVTLCREKSGSIGPFESLTSVVSKRDHTLNRLEAPGIEAFPPWRALLVPVSLYNSQFGGGITTVKLPGLWTCYEGTECQRSPPPVRRSALPRKPTLG
jgi:hypothetical protein